MGLRRERNIPAHDAFRHTTRRTDIRQSRAQMTSRTQATTTNRDSDTLRSRDTHETKLVTNTRPSNWRSAIVCPNEKLVLNTLGFHTHQANARRYDTQVAF